MEEKKILKPQCCSKCQVAVIKKNVLYCPCSRKEVALENERELWFDCPIDWGK